MSSPLRVVSQIAASALALTAFLSLGCSTSAPTASTASAAPAASSATVPTIVAAKAPFFAMYKSAHEWAQDVVPIRLSQKELQGYRNEAGNAGMWEAAFASPSLHKYRIYTYAVDNVSPGIFKGVKAGLPLTWGGETRDAMAIDITTFNTDSDAAFQTASANAADWLKKNPGKELTALELGQTARFAGPVWYVQWGTKAAGYSALVDATTGKLLNRK